VEVDLKYNPPYGISDPNGPYINGDPSVDRPGSIPPAASIEYPQRELVNLISDVGVLTPDNGDLHQLGRSIQTGGLNYQEDTGTANAYACNLSPAPLGYVAGLFAVIHIANDNTGPSVLNLNSLGNKKIVRLDGSDVIAGDLKQGNMQCLMFDGTNFQAVWMQKISGTGGGQPTYLLAPRTLYVNGTTGNDSYDGFTASFSTGIHGPFRTIQRAADELIRYNLNGYNVTINVADGNYLGQTHWHPLNGSGAVYIYGNQASPTNVNLSSSAGTVFVFNGGGYAVIGFKFSCSGTATNDAGNGIWVIANPVTIQDCHFGACVGNHIVCSEGLIYLLGTLTVDAGAASFINSDGGRYAFDGALRPALVLTAVPNFSGAFIIAMDAARVVGTFSTITGTATGSKYTATTNSIINTNGAGINYFPGNAAGTTNTGGQYI
jgi:hypothetical protein